MLRFIKSRLPFRLLSICPPIGSSSLFPLVCFRTFTKMEKSLQRILPYFLRYDFFCCLWGQLPDHLVSCLMWLIWDGGAVGTQRKWMSVCQTQPSCLLQVCQTAQCWMQTLTHNHWHILPFCPLHMQFIALYSSTALSNRTMQNSPAASIVIPINIHCLHESESICFHPSCRKHHSSWFSY